MNSSIGLRAWHGLKSSHTGQRVVDEKMPDDKNRSETPDGDRPQSWEASGTWSTTCRRRRSEDAMAKQLSPGSVSCERGRDGVYGNCYQGVTDPEERPPRTLQEHPAPMLAG